MAEWRATALSLAEHFRVLAVDQRGHGASTRVPPDVSRAAHVGDTVALIEDLELGPCVLVGHALGGHTAFLVAAERPDLVRRLVIAETSPECDPLARERIAVLLRAWPTPFPTQAAAREFFGGESEITSIWLEGLEERAGGWWPRFERSVVLDALDELTRKTFWLDWECVRAPTLIVRGEHGLLERDIAEKMLQGGATAELVEILGGGHHVHLEQGPAWLEAIGPFINGSSMPGAAASKPR